MLILLAGFAPAQGGTAVTQIILTDLPIRALAADFDGDANGDLVVLSRDTNALTLLLGDGIGGFTPDPAPPSALGSAVGHEAMAVGDIDGADGPDIAVANRVDGVVTVLMNDGLGGFAATAIDLNTILGASVNPVALAIVPGTPGEVWVALAGSLFPGHLLRITDPAGSPVVSVIASGGSFNDVTVGDFDSDGDPDVAAANTSTGAAGGLHLFLNDGIGGFSSSGPVLLAGIGGGITSVAAGDLDGDGFDNDLAVSYVPVSGPFTGLGGTAAVLDASSPVVTTLRTSVAGRSAVIGRFGGAIGRRDVMEVQAFGAVRSHIDFDAGAFDLAADLDGALGGFTGPDVLRLSAGDLLPTSLPCAWRVGDLDELIAVSQTTSSVYIVDFSEWALAPEAVAAADGDAGVLFTTTGSPTLGDATFSIGIEGAAPFASALLVVQDQSTGYAAVTPLAAGTGTVIDFLDPFLMIPMILDAAGDATLPVPIPSDPALGCLALGAQWAVYDGLGVNSGITISQGYRIAIGNL